jgi:hypothetical protein
MFNEEARKIHLNIVDKLDGFLKKYEMKMLGCWFALSEHTLYEVYYAPSLEAFEKMSQEPEIVKWSEYNTMEIKLVHPLEDVMKILKRPQ